jgi:hypothetical protein
MGRVQGNGGRVPSGISLSGSNPDCDMSIYNGKNIYLFFFFLFFFFVFLSLFLSTPPRARVPGNASQRSDEAVADELAGSTEPVAGLPLHPDEQYQSEIAMVG